MNLVAQFFLHGNVSAGYLTLGIVFLDDLVNDLFSGFFDRVYGEQQASHVNTGEKFPVFTGFRFPVLGRFESIEANGSVVQPAFHAVRIRLETKDMGVMKEPVKHGRRHRFIAHQLRPL